MTPTDRPPTKRRSHLMDPDAPRLVRTRQAEQSLTRVQQWIMSTLAVTIILHMSGGLILAAMNLSSPTRSAQIGLAIIAGAFGAVAVAVALAIHRRSVLSPWLLLGLLPTGIGLWLTLG